MYFRQFDCLAISGKLTTSGTMTTIEPVILTIVRNDFINRNYVRLLHWFLRPACAKHQTRNTTYVHSSDDLRRQRSDCGMSCIMRTRDTQSGTDTVRIGVPSGLLP